MHAPQGLEPGYHTVTVMSQACASQPKLVSILATPNAIVRAADQPVGAFEIIASRGPNSIASFAFLCLAPDSQPTLVPGIVDLGIGSQGQTLIVWPGAVGNDPVTGVFRWQAPDLAGFLPLHLQAAIIDLLAPNPFPLSVTDVEVVMP